MIYFILYALPIPNVGDLFQLSFLTQRTQRFRRLRGYYYSSLALFELVFCFARGPYQYLQKHIFLFPGEDKSGKAAG